MKYKLTALQILMWGQFVFLSFLLAIAHHTQAQNVAWANGITNPTDDITVKNICINNAGESFAVGFFYDKVDFDEGAGIDTISTDMVNGYPHTRAGFVTKTDNAGNHMWAKAVIPYTAPSYSEIYDVATDAAGNAFIVGTYHYTVDFDPGPGIDSLNSHLTQGSFLIKLDPAGNFLWAKTSAATMYAVKTDQNNNVIISGYFAGTVDFDPGPAVYNMTAGANAMYVLKLDNNGNFIWANFWNNSVHNLVNYLRRNIDIDGSGNIYVCAGITNGTQVDLDPGPAVYTDSGKTYAVKLDPSGNFVWGNATTERTCVLMAAKNKEFYTAGAHPVYQNVILSKYDSAGTQIWTKTIEDPLLAPQYLGLNVNSITEDTTGNIIVAGRYAGKYLVYNADSAGNFLWLKKSDGNVYIDDLCAKVNASNDLMLSGDFKNVFDADFGPAVHAIGDSGKYAFLLMKYNYCGNNFTLNFNVCDSLVLSDTTLYASANYTKEYLDMANCDSNLIVHAIVNVLKDTVINVCDSAVYNGQTYTQSGVYTQIFPPVALGCDSIKTIYVNINTPAGLPPFLNQIQTFQPYFPPLPGYYTPASLNVEIDSLYNMYISGTFSQEIDFNPLGVPYIDTSLYPLYGVPDGFVTRYDSSGLLNWMHKIQTNDVLSGNEYTPSLCLNDGLELYSCTYGKGGSNIGMNKVNQFAYANTWFGTTQIIGYSGWNVNQILNDPTINLPVKIGFHDSIDFNYAYKKLVVWRGNTSATFATGGQYIGMNGAVDSQGNIYVVSSMQPIFGGTTYCTIAKLDSNLNMLWNKQIATGLGISQLKIDTGGSLLLCGSFTGTVDMDISPASYNLVSNGASDAYIARFDTAANFIWAQSFGGTGDDAANSIITDMNGKIYIGGNFASPSIDLDPSAGVTFLMKSCVNTNWQGGYISKFKPDGTFMNAMGSGKNITELEFKAPKRIYATGIPFVQVFELGNDVIVNVSDTICAGDSVVVGNSVYYQTGVYTAIFPLAPASDSIVVTHLTVNPLPIVVANASDTSLCMGDSVALFGSGANTYVWNNAVVDNVIFSPLATNNYLVTGTDFNGCVNQDSIEIVVNALPAITANATDTITCLGDSIILFGSGGMSYVWNNLVIDSVLFAPLATGYFAVTGTDTNGCVNTDSIEVIVHTLPLVIANASDTSLCSGDSVMLFGTGALTYTWNNLVIDSTIFSPAITNTYLVAGNDTNGCVNTDSITVIVNALPIVVANASDTSVCIGNAVTLYGTGADSFSWTNGVIDSVAFYPLDTVMYVVTGIDVNGCVNQDSILVSAHQIPLPVLVFSGDTLYCTNVTGVTYYWFKDTVAVDSLINYYVVTQNGNYQVLVVDSNGCVGADTISILNLGNLNINRFSQINVYPNPAHDELTIVFETIKAGDIELTMSDLSGKRLYTSKRKIASSGKQSQKIDLTKINLQSGMYFLNIMIEGKRHVVKVELQK